MAFVYDLAAATKTIYFNGFVDAYVPLSAPVQSYVVNMTFGCFSVAGDAPTEFFIGYMDQMLYNSRVKNASEILNDATLVFHYPFLATAPLIDSGPNHINGTLEGGAVSIASGIVNQAMNFPTSGSYF